MELDDENDYKNYESPEQMSEQLVTLSLLPDSFFHNCYCKNKIYIIFVKSRVER